MASDPRDGLFIPRWFLWLQSVITPAILASALWGAASLNNLKAQFAVMTTRLDLMAAEFEKRSAVVHLLQEDIHRLELQLTELRRDTMTLD